MLADAALLSRISHSLQAPLLAGNTSAFPASVCCIKWSACDVIQLVLQNHLCNAWLTSSDWDVLAGQLVFVPSYFDYVRLRNFMQANNVTFAGMNEYASHSELARGRSYFADGRARVALLTERCLFYHHMRLSNIQVRSFAASFGLSNLTRTHSLSSTVHQDSLVFIAVNSLSAPSLLLLQDVQLALWCNHQSPSGLQ